MPRRRRLDKSRRLHCGDLEGGQLFDLLLGDDGSFASDDERRRTWFLVRTEMLSDRPAGRRPAAWWDYETEAPKYGREPECLRLFRIGELFGDELAAVEAYWKRELERAESMRAFWQHLDKPQLGDIYYVNHCQWAGVPSERMQPAAEDYES